MTPLGSQTRKQGDGVGEPGTGVEPLKLITLSLVSGAACQLIGLGVIACPVSSLTVLRLMSGGSRSAAVPKGSESCQESSHWTGLLQLPVVYWHRLCTSCSAQLIEPSDRFQPSPTQGAA